MIHKIVIVCLFVSVFFNVSAQRQINGIITGIIVDKLSKEPIEFANVVVRTESDSAPIAGTTTDAKGKFSFEKVADGIYKISCSFIGFEKQETPLFTLNEQNRNINLGTLDLSFSNQDINEVVAIG